MPEFRTLLRNTERLLTNNSPAIFAGLGVIGTITTAYLTGTASFKAAEIIRQEESIGGTAGDPKQRLKERIRLVWKLYLPAVGMATLTIGAMISSNRISERRAVAVAAAYSLTERAFSEYREKVVQKIGANKEEAVRAEIAQERLARNPVPSREIIVAGGDVLCYESFTGRVFQSDVETLRKAQNDINATILHDGHASLSEFYYLIGLPTTSMSDDVGWNSDRLLDLQLSAILTEDNRPCIAVDYSVVPSRNYYRQH